MNTPEKGQLYIDDWIEGQEKKDEKLPEEKVLASEKSDNDGEGRDCPSCGGSGSCRSCERGRAWAKEQGYTFRTSNNSRRRRK